jgi:molybdopterin adenylyltransferase
MSVDPLGESRYNRRVIEDKMTETGPIRVGVVTVSDKGHAGEREDASGPLLVALLQKIGAEVVRQEIVPDERAEIERVLADLADEARVDLIVTTGGTGLSPRDVTPEAARAVIEREAPGLAEVLRFEGYRKTPLAVLSRGVAGVRGRTLIVNLPGSPKAVREGMEVLSPIIPHAIRMARGVDTEHGGPEVPPSEMGLA